MSAQVPTGERRAAIISSEFVPLTVEEFRNGYATFSDGLDGKLPRDPDFPTEYHDAVTGAAKPVEDTPFNRAWIAAGKLFADAAPLSRGKLDAPRHGRPRPTISPGKTAPLRIALSWAPFTLARRPCSWRSSTGSPAISRSLRR